MKYARTAPSCQETRNKTDGSCTLTGHSRDKAREQGPSSSHPPQLCFQQGKKVSNNIAEFEGLLTGLRAAAALGVKRLTITGDSQLLVNFSNKEYTPKDEHMEVYLEGVRKMEKQFMGVEL